MPNDTRTRLKVGGNRSYGGMNPPQSRDLNINEAVWDHLDRERNKRLPASKEEYEEEKKRVQAVLYQYAPFSLYFRALPHAPPHCTSNLKLNMHNSTTLTFFQNLMND